MPEPLLVGVKEAAREVGCGRDRMYELVRTGRVRSISFGQRRLIPRTELAAWIERELAEGGDAMAHNGAGNGTRPPTGAAPRA